MTRRLTLILLLATIVVTAPATAQQATQTPLRRPDIHWVPTPPAVVDAIVGGRPAALTDKREAVVYDVALALANGRLIPQDLYDRAVEALGHEGITDVIVLMGYYTCVSLTMNFYSVPVSGGGTPRH